jgi:DNA-binding PadR family transcriptional regulator
MYWSQLYKKIKESYKYMALETFNSCIKNLINKNLISRQDVLKPGKKVVYSLTEKGKQYVRLILTEPQKEINGTKETRLHVYLLLFMFNQPPRYIFETEKDLDDFLLENSLSTKDLVPLRKKEESKDGKMIVVTVFKTLSGIVVVEKEPLNAEPSDGGAQSYFDCYIPGLSITDILYSRSRPAFWHINFTHSEVQHVFNLLQNEGILQAIKIMYHGELRYEIRDPILVDFLDDCAMLYRRARESIEEIWKHIRKPSRDEIRWLELIMGTEKVDEIRRESYRRRHNRSVIYKRLRKKEDRKRKIKLIMEDNELSTRFAMELKESHSNAIRKYRFPSEELLDLIYPKFLQQMVLR